jgi:predicted aspartyl protease
VTCLGRIVAVLLAGACPSLACAQDISLDPEDSPAVVRTGADASDRVTIPIHIDGKGPYNFIVDTGSQRTVISRELATTLALVPDTQVSVLSLTGFSNVDTVTVPNLSFGSSRIKGVKAPVFGGEALGAAGLIGLDGLHRKRLILDFQNKRMDIGPSSKHSLSDTDAIIVEARSRLGQLILVDSKADGEKVHVILDTGTSSSIGNAALLRKLISRRRDAFAAPVMITSVTGGQLAGQWGYIRNISLGRVSMRNVAVVFTDTTLFSELGLGDKPALLLGVDVLRNFRRVAIDFGRKQVDFILPDQGSLPAASLAAREPEAKAPNAYPLAMP